MLVGMTVSSRRLLDSTVLMKPRGLTANFPSELAQARNEFAIYPPPSADLAVANGPRGDDLYFR